MSRNTPSQSPVTLRSIVAGAAFALAAGLAHAHAYKLGAIDIGHPYARPTVAGQRNGGAFLKLENHGGDDRLVSVSTDVAGAAQLHSMSMQGDVMRMREVGSIDLPAGQTVDLAPGGYHVMLVGLKAPLKAGDTFPLKLRFEKAGEVEVKVNVEAPAAAASAPHMH